MKVVINTKFGGFGLSQEAIDMYISLSGMESEDDLYVWDLYRADPILVKVVEELGTERANGCYAELKIIEIPNDVNWEIHEYDGIETIHEKHMCWS